MKIIRAEKISKSYGEKQVLNQVTFSVDEGEKYVLIGPSGSGKTTILRIVNGLEEPDNGAVYFKGVSVFDGGSVDISLRRKMVMLFQKPIVFNMSVFDNIAYGLKIRKLEWNTVKRKVKEALELVGLSGYEDKNALLLSGGEAQRVAFARCLVVEPEFLLLDEPTANLDPPNVALIEKLIKDMNERFNTAFLISTHNMLQARRISDRVGFLFEGELVEEGYPEDVLNSPKRKITKDFVEGRIVF